MDCPIEALRITLGAFPFVLTGLIIKLGSP